MWPDGDGCRGEAGDELSPCDDGGGKESRGGAALFKGAYTGEGAMSGGVGRYVVGGVQEGVGSEVEDKTHDS